MKGFGISIGVSPREPLKRFAEVVAEAESLGCEAAWVVDFQLGLKDVYAALLLAAGASSRILLGPGVTNFVTRHPTVTANAITAVDEVSDGRAVLGLGTGATAVFGANAAPSTLADVRRWVGALRGLFTGAETDLGDGGPPVQLAAARRQIPIYLSASQPRMLRLAGEIADGVIMMGAADPDFCRWQLEHVYSGLEASGRPREALTIDLFVTMSANSEVAEAVSDVRAWAVGQASGFARWKELPAACLPFRSDFERARSAYHLVEHLSLHASHNDSISEDFVRWAAIAGTEADCVARLERLAALDLDRISFALLSGGRSRRLHQLAERILPRLPAPTRS